jgi:hypothetical protein
MGIRAAAGAVAAGVREAGGVACARCAEVPDADAKFCGACGSPMGAAYPVCDASNEAGANEAGARFCDQCGAGLA